MRFEVVRLNNAEVAGEGGRGEIPVLHPLCMTPWYSGTLRTGSNLFMIPGECTEVII